MGNGGAKGGEVAGAPAQKKAGVRRNSSKRSASYRVDVEPEPSQKAAAAAPPPVVDERKAEAAPRAEAPAVAAPEPAATKATREVHTPEMRRLDDAEDGYDSENHDEAIKVATAEDLPPQVVSRATYGSPAPLGGPESTSWEEAASSPQQAYSRIKSSRSLEVLAPTMNEALAALFELLPFYRQDDANVDALVRATVAKMTPEDCLTRDASGSTALIVCAQYGHDDLAELMLARGAEVDATSTAGVTALSYACGSEAFSEPMIRLLLSSEADPTIPEQHYGCTALHYLSATGNERLCRLLVDRGADPGASDWYSWQPADYAQDAGHEDLAKVLRDMAKAKNAAFLRSCASSSNLGALLLHQQGGASSPSHGGSSSSGSGVQRPGTASSLVRRGSVSNLVSAATMEQLVAEANEKAEAKFAEDRRQHEAELKKMEADVEKARSAAAVLGFENKTLKDELADEKQAKLDMRTKLASSEEQMGANSSLAEALATQATEGDNRVRRLESELNVEKSQNAQLRESLDRLRLSAADGSKVQEDAIHQAATLEGRLAELEADLARVRQDRDDARVDAEAMRREVEEKRRDVDTAKGEADRAVQQALDRADQLKQRCEATIAETHRDAETRVSEARAAEAAAAEDLRATKRGLADARDAAREAVDRAAALDSAVREAHVIQQRNEQLDRDLTNEMKRRKVLHNLIEDMKGRIRVYCRVRPMSSSEAEKNCKVACMTSGDKGLTILRPDRKPPQDKQHFDFDRSFMGTDETNSQERVFADVKSLVLSCIDGFNVCVLAYGQTGSGKTFTMGGAKSARESVDTKTWDVDATAGIIPRAAVEIFRKFDERKAQCDTELELSMFELYMNALVDLQSPKGEASSSSNTTTLKIKLAQQTKSGLVEVEGAVTKQPKDLEDLIEALEQGLSRRATAHTAMNASSSRSHLIIALVLKTTNRRTGHVVNGKLTLVDLAGSERVEKSGVVGDQLKEATSINKSLSAIGDVIGALSSQKGGHIPYRNHPLTMLMSDSLGGSAKTLMFVNCSPADYNVSETTSSLTFATRCKTVKTQEPGVMAGELNALKAELQRMKQSGKQAPSKAPLIKPHPHGR